MRTSGCALALPRFLFCCMTQLLLCCWYVALFSRSVKLCNAFFYIYNQNNKGYFLEETGCDALIFSVDGGNCYVGLFLEQDDHLPSFLQLQKVTRACFPLSNAEVTPWGSLRLAFQLQGFLHPLSFWSLTSFRKRGALWTLLDWKNQLTLMSLPGAYKWFPFLMCCSPGSICPVLGCSQSHHTGKSENYPLSSSLCSLLKQVRDWEWTGGLLPSPQVQMSAEHVFLHPK